MAEDDDLEHGWGEDGQPSASISIEQVLKRAIWAAQVAHKGRGTKDQSTMQTMEERGMWAVTATAHATLAMAMQNERDYEERKVREIRDQAQEET